MEKLLRIVIHHQDPFPPQVPVRIFVDELPEGCGMRGPALLILFLDALHFFIQGKKGYGP